MAEETLESLPAGDPEQGFIGPEPVKGFNDGESQEDFDERHGEWEEQAKAVAENEDAIVKQRRKDAEASGEEAPASSTKATSTKSGSSTSSSSSSS